MHIKKMMNDIIYKGDKNDMDYLGDTFVDMVYALKDKNPMRYKSIEYEMSKLAYGCHLTREQAECWVDNMENADGTTGGHWTYDQTEQVKPSDLDSNDWYAILNSVYSDYYSTNFDTNIYIELAKNFLKDKDAVKDKALVYYIFITN